MKFGVLTSIAHNLADSLSGCSLLTGCYGLAPFDDAARSACGFVEIDLLAGKCTHGDASEDLLIATAKAASQALPELCARAGGSPSEFKTFLVRYIAGAAGTGIEVTVENASGRRRTDFYLPWPARRPKILDPRGRIRTARD
ncbi:MAG TPA: hypothetical protein VF693_01760 [Allosphingosinicella sp.]|jgi:hypothetical protein